MKKLKIFVFCLAVFSTMQNVYGQYDKNDPPLPGGAPPEWALRNQARARQAQRQNGVDNNIQFGNIVRGRPLSMREREAIAGRAGNFEKARGMLRAPQEYYEKYAEFLESKKIGLARLFVDKNCYGGKAEPTQKSVKCADVAPVEGDGSYFSFREHRNFGSGEDWWDIKFKDGKFTVGNDTVQGLITELGDVGIQNINLKSDAVKFLNDYKPKRTFDEIKKGREILRKGVVENGFSYSDAAPVKLNSVYVLRSAAYRLKDKNRIENFVKGLDVTTVFKVVGLEKDGSAIILFKHLRTELPRRELE